MRSRQRGRIFYDEGIVFESPRSSCHVGIVLSHPSRKNKDAARVGHPHCRERDKETRLL
jgi:hypothetical protein